MEPKRRTPSMSKFIAGLNAPVAPASSAGEFDDLTFFASTDIFDFDAIDASPVDQSVAMTQPDASSSSIPPWSLQTGPDYVLPDFSLHGQYPAGSLSGSDLIDPLLPVSPNNGFAMSPQLGSPTAAANASQRRMLDLGNPHLPPAERAKLEAEEDKRRRNTAASARFRVKKKQREQALEKAAREMTDRLTAHETRIKELEQENKWLKGLLTECGGQSFKEVLDKRTASDIGEESEPKREKIDD